MKKNGMLLISGAVAVGLASASMTTSAAPSFTEKDISEVGWSVNYVGCTYDSAENVSTYHYQLDASVDEKDLSHWVLGVESDITPVSIVGSAQTDLGLDPTTGVYGVKWDDGQDAGTTSAYSVSYNGTCSEVATVYSVKGGTYYAVAATTGPGEGSTNDSTYSISGTAFVDINGDGILNDGEPVVSDASVYLYDTNGALVAYLKTDTSGNYEFAGLANGAYTVEIPAASDQSDFNESLSEYFMANSGARYVAVNQADVSDQDFSYTLLLENVMADLDLSDPDADGYSFQGTGKTIGFWKHQHSVAIKGKGRAHIDANTLQGYLISIEGLWLADPFQFGVDFFVGSMDILSSKSSDARDLLNKQLLGTELNHMDGRGISDNMSLQAMVIACAEYYSSNASSFTRDQVLSVKDLLDAINNSGE